MTRIKALRGPDTNTSATINNQNGQMTPFDRMAGALMGVTLASFLFIIIFKYIFLHLT